MSPGWLLGAVVLADIVLGELANRTFDAMREEVSTLGPLARNDVWELIRNFGTFAGMMIWSQSGR